MVNIHGFLFTPYIAFETKALYYGPYAILTLLDKNNKTTSVKIIQNAVAIYFKLFQYISPQATGLSGIPAMQHGQVQHASIQHSRLHHEMVEATHESLHAFKFQGCPSSYPGRHCEHHRGLRLLYHNLQEPDSHHHSDEGCLSKGCSMKDIKKTQNSPLLWHPHCVLFVLTAYWFRRQIIEKSNHQVAKFSVMMFASATFGTLWSPAGP